MGFEIKENTTFQISGHTIKNVNIYEFRLENNEVIPFVVSSNLISKIHKAGNPKYNSSHLYISSKNRAESMCYLILKYCITGSSLK